MPCVRVGRNEGSSRSHLKLTNEIFHFFSSREWQDLVRNSHSTLVCQFCCAVDYKCQNRLSADLNAIFSERILFFSVFIQKTTILAAAC